METRDQGLLLGIQIDGVTSFIVGDMSSQTFDSDYISPTVVFATVFMTKFKTGFVSGFMTGCDRIHDRIHDRFAT